MNISLLTSDPSSTIHLMYFLGASGRKVSNVVCVGEKSERFAVLEDSVERFDARISYVAHHEDPLCIKLLSGLEIDILVILLDKIISDHVIQTARVGVLNAHAGILPRYRGVDSRRWAILEGGDVGVSAHLVDAGVDTGGILAVTKLERFNGESLAQISRRNYYENKWQTLGRALDRLESGEPIPCSQLSTEGKQYFWMHKKLRKIVDDFLVGAGASE